MNIKKIKVGIIDDSTLVRIYTKAMLSRSITPVFDVVLDAASSLEVIENLKSHPILDVLLLDVNMPFMNGIDSIPHLKKLFPTARIIMFTDDEDRNKITRAFQLGAYDYIPKNINHKLLIERISRSALVTINSNLESRLTK